MKDPSRIFNMDESGFSMDGSGGRKEKKYGPTGAKHMYALKPGGKENMTTCCCFSAYGDFMPAMLVFAGKRMPKIRFQDYANAYYEVTKNGWMEQPTFIKWLHYFSTWVMTLAHVKRPIILFVDGHASHVSQGAAEFCRDNGIILYCLHPNASHIQQPCDIGLFFPLKQAWKKSVELWQHANLGRSLSRKNFNGVIKGVYEIYQTTELAARSFRRSGLYPFTIEGIDGSKFMESTANINGVDATPTPSNR